MRGGLEGLFCGVSPLQCSTALFADYDIIQIKLFLIKLSVSMNYLVDIVPRLD